jgi:hypothetical protein
VLARYAYGYDAAANRTMEQIDDALRIAGELNEAASVTSNGKAATVDASNRFTATTPITSGAKEFTVGIGPA